MYSDWYSLISLLCVVSPTLFNILLDTVVRKWLVDVMDDMTTARADLWGDNIGCMSSLFYANDGAIGSLNHEWLQNRPKLWAVILEKFRDSAQWKAINANMKVLETFTTRGKEKELYVPFLTAVKTWHLDPYNLSYVRNTEWMLAVQSSPNQ